MPKYEGDDAMKQLEKTKEISAAKSSMFERIDCAVQEHDTQSQQQEGTRARPSRDIENQEEEKTQRHPSERAESESSWSSSSEESM